MTIKTRHYQLSIIHFQFVIVVLYSIIMQQSKILKILSLFFVFLFIANFTLAQPCGNDIIHLKRQSQIDSFPIIYPDCTTINGTLKISYIGSQTIDLSPLNQISAIDSSLEISAGRLYNLNGLHNLESIGHNFFVNASDLLNLDALANLKSIGNSFSLRANSIESIEGLSNLDSIGFDVRISSESLASLEGLNNIKFINDGLVIESESLSNFIGLDALEEVRGTLHFFGSNASLLESVDGLDNLKSITGNLRIEGHPMLSDLADFTKLESLGGMNIRYSYLSSFIGLEGVHSISSSVRIDTNFVLSSFEGLNNIERVEGLIEISRNPVLENMQGLDALQSVHEFVIAKNPMLSSLIGLESLEVIENSLFVEENALQNFTGLNNLELLESILSVRNSNVQNFVGLDKLQQTILLNLWNNPNLESLEGLHLRHLTYLYARNNDALKNLKGLESLEELNIIRIQNNDIISSLIGIENVNPDSIYHTNLGGGASITLTDNPLLQVCNQIPICIALERPETMDEISGNKTDCNSRTEILNLCGTTATFSPDNNEDLLIHPNPTHDFVTVYSKSLKDLSIFNLQGRVVLESSLRKGENVIHIESLESGLYYLQIENGPTHKLIKI